MDCCSPTFLFVSIRAVHYIACLLLLAVWAFDRIVLPAASLEIGKRWRFVEMRWTLVILPIIGISGAAWFVQVCVNMSGLPLREAMRPETIRLVWRETTFGRVWQLRAAIWVGSILVFSMFHLHLRERVRDALGWVIVILAGITASSLAWAGHGQEGGRGHLAADSLHLCIAGFWPMGLAPFLLLLWRMRTLPWNERGPSVVLMVFRFSTMSLISVALLTISGLINGLYMVGSFGDLVETNYGRVLLLKVGLFVSMLLIGGFNLLRLKPRLLKPEAAASAAMLRWTVAGELLLGLLVFIVTAALGLMMPGA